jgi:hypothetical protein
MSETFGSGYFWASETKLDTRLYFEGCIRERLQRILVFNYRPLSPVKEEQYQVNSKANLRDKMPNGGSGVAPERKALDRY